ncbi:Do family serine endopeptidase [Eisenibacter elegans]|jgi:Do/DeqQ family serine protease|uniref:Do family serine endopeptidase n=1 Tax=Eisenibacter elegans TaxID=997 RepID=UPI00054EF831|nr:Do family serine endopeptidase [Eisenibacter elegans]
MRNLSSQWVPLVVVALLASTLTLAANYWLDSRQAAVVFWEAPAKEVDTKLVNSKGGATMGEDFREAAAQTTRSVVHIKATQVRTARQQQRDWNPFEEFFGEDFFRFRQGPGNNRPSQSSGSGVIVSKDGYIVTNNHVVADAAEIEVVLNNKQSYTARVVGTDPSTDLAVIKIEAADLPAILMGNSDVVEVGEWVLAVGNPFNLESTVTAGIVSAKGRNLNLLRDQAPIESFIQTDAAVNPGNSGGALVNTRGELIGINTAIATPTGTFAGYSFAVPVNLVKKVLKDLIEFGEVQRAYLGVYIREVDAALTREKNIDINQGVYVDSLVTNGSAAAAGIRKGDVITAVGDKEVRTVPELMEAVARYRPGEKTNIKVRRNKQEQTISVTFKNRSGGEEIVRKETAKPLQSLGADFEELDAAQKQKMRLSHGVRVRKLYEGKLRRDTNIQEGFVITEIGGKPIRNIAELEQVLSRTKGGILIEGYYPDQPTKYYYGIGLE